MSGVELRASPKRRVTTTEAGAGRSSERRVILPDAPRVGELPPIGRTPKPGTVLRTLAIAKKPRAELEKEDLRLHVAVAGRATQVPFREAMAPGKPMRAGVYQAVTAAQVEGAYDAALAAREAHLRDLANAPSAPTVSPEDGQDYVAAFHMSYGSMDQANERFIEQLAAIGRGEGFEVVVRTAPEFVPDLERWVERRDRNNMVVVASTHFGDIWTEDAGEIHRNRSVGVSAPGVEYEQLREALYRGRIERYYPDARVPARIKPETLEAQIAKKYPDAGFGMLGVTDSRDAQRGMVAVAVSAGSEVRVNFGAVEGGNMLAGRLPNGEVYTLIGRDSWVATRLVLERDLGRPVSDEEIRLALSKDYGVKPQNVHPVEQPADFHLDVKMLPIGPGRIMLNDAVAAMQIVEAGAHKRHATEEPKPPKRASVTAQKNYREAVDEWKAAGKQLEEDLAGGRARAERQAKGEARTARDLERAGLQVLRVPGVFPWVAGSPMMNFINAEQGRGRDGERFYIGLGGTSEQEQAFVKAMIAADAGYARYYFLDRALTHNTLYAGGGISCRAKVELIV